MASRCCYQLPNGHSFRACAGSEVQKKITSVLSVLSFNISSAIQPLVSIMFRYLWLSASHSWVTASASSPRLVGWTSLFRMAWSKASWGIEVRRIRWLWQLLNFFILQEIMQGTVSVSWSIVMMEQKVPAEVSPGIRKPFCLQQLPVGVGSDVSLQDHKIGSATIMHPKHVLIPRRGAQ